MNDDWRAHARALADQLSESGHVRSQEWREAFGTVPRHEFVPEFFEQTAPGQWRTVSGADPDQRDQWARAVYSDTTLVTALHEMELPEDAGLDGFAVAVSSSTEPGLMAQMLDDLDVEPGHTVLEIGTGTGYNAALLCQRLGDEHVYSVDLRPAQVRAAARALARAGHRPTLVTADGAHGLEQHAPYDRIIATCSVRYIPPPWIAQLRPGGKLLADVEGTISAGNLAELHRQDDLRVHGRFSSRYGSFMAMEHQLGIEPGRSHGFDPRAPTRRTTAVSPDLLHRRQVPAGFFAQLHLPTGTLLQLTNDGADTRLVAPDGSWCDVANQPDTAGRHRVDEGGPQQLWHVVEDAHVRYINLGSPDWNRFGVTSTPTWQTIWLDTPDTTWPIPLSEPP